MYPSFGATLAQIGIRYRTVWSFCDPVTINEAVLCLGARKKQLAALCIRLVLTHFLFWNKGEDSAAQLSRGGFSKPLDTATILQRAMTEQCTNSRLCVWPLH